jgi:NAD(P)H-dependent FMN reductase
MVKIQIIVGSTRPGRNAPAVAEWVRELASQRHDMEVELVDIADYNLPLLDEPVPPSLGQYSKDYTKKWAAKIAEADGYVFIAPEYNHSIPAALKNAIDYLYAEWNNKAAGFVSYGSASGVRSVEHLRGVMGEIQIADVRAQVFMSLATDFVNYSEFKPGETRAAELGVMLDQLAAWSEAMKTVRK